MPDLVKVAKFGGTSMADFTAMKRCASIVSSDPDKRIIVVSATSGTTNLLTELTIEKSVDTRSEIVSAIRKKHLAICEDLGRYDQFAAY